MSDYAFSRGAESFREHFLLHLPRHCPNYKLETGTRHKIGLNSRAPSNPHLYNPPIQESCYPLLVGLYLFQKIPSEACERFAQ